MNNIFLSNADELIDAFQNALDGAAQVDVAVAWATRCNQLRLLCDYAQSGGKLRAIVGRAFPTDPYAVESLLDARPGHVRWGRTPPFGIFHPKVFLFHHSDQIIAIVGSANLTRRAFRSNVEATMHLRGSATELSQFVQFFTIQWCSAEDVNDANLETYKETYNIHWHAQQEYQRQAHQDSQPRGTGPIRAAESGPILSWTWDQYVEQLECVDKLWQPYVPDLIELYLAMLGALSKLARRPLSSLSRVQRLALFGIKSAEFQNADWLGSMKASRMTRQALTDNDATSRRTQAAVTAALKKVPSGPTLPSLQDVAAAYHALREIKDVGPGIATRYLTLVRPDACMSLNGASQEGLSRVLGVPVSRLRTWDGYAQALKHLWSAPWMTAPKPTSCSEEPFWENRSALLDAFVYRPRSGEHPDVTWQ